MWFRRGAKDAWADVNYMELVPERKLTSEDLAETDRVAILMPRYTDPILSRIVQPYLKPEKRFIRVPLEDRGTFLWRLLDGKRNVSELADSFRVRFPEDSDDCSVRVAQYLHAMYENRFIGYVNDPT